MDLLFGKYKLHIGFTTKKTLSTHFFSVRSYGVDVVVARYCQPDQVT